MMPPYAVERLTFRRVLLHALTPTLRRVVERLGVSGRDEATAWQCAILGTLIALENVKRDPARARLLDGADLCRSAAFRSLAVAAAEDEIERWRAAGQQ